MKCSPLYAALGIGCGLLGMAYNRTILTAVAVSRVCARWPRGLQGALIGAGVGLLAWFLPDLVGGGITSLRAFSPAKPPC